MILDLTDDEFEILSAGLSLRISQSKELYRMCCGVGPFKDDIAEGEKLQEKLKEAREKQA